MSLCGKPRASREAWWCLQSEGQRRDEGCGAEGRPGLLSGGERLGEVSGRNLRFDGLANISTAGCGGEPRAHSQPAPRWGEGACPRGPSQQGSAPLCSRAQPGDSAPSPPGPAAGSGPPASAEVRRMMQPCQACGEPESCPHSLLPCVIETTRSCSERQTPGMARCVCGGVGGTHLKTRNSKIITARPNDPRFHRKVSLQISVSPLKTFTYHGILE